MRTARLIATLFYILCPHCNRLLRKPDGSQTFAAGEQVGGEQLYGGRVLRCSSEDCKLEFRLPNTLKAAAEELPADGAGIEGAAGAAANAAGAAGSNLRGTT